MGFFLQLILSPVFVQLFRFGIVGASTLLLDFALYISLTRGIAYFAVHFLLANAIAFIADVTWNFYWNRRWTFRVRSRGVGYQYAAFFGVALTGLGWNQLLLFAFVRGFGIYDLVAKLLAIAVVFLWNFCMQRAVTFRLVPALVNRRL